MRFRYGDPKISTDRSNGEKADAEDSKRAEGDEVLLNSVLTPLSTDETHTIATESKGTENCSTVRLYLSILQLNL